MAPKVAKPFAKKTEKKGRVEEREAGREMKECVSFRVGCKECSVSGKGAKSVEAKAVDWNKHHYK